MGQGKVGFPADLSRSAWRKLKEKYLEGKKRMMSKQRSEPFSDYYKQRAGVGEKKKKNLNEGKGTSQILLTSV